MSGIHARRLVELGMLPEIAVKGAQTAVEFLGLIVLLAGTMWTSALARRLDDVYF